MVKPPPHKPAQGPSSSTFYLVISLTTFEVKPTFENTFYLKTP
jgi:hypothetical protein